MTEAGRLVFTIVLDDQGKPIVEDIDKIKASISQLEGTAVPATTGMSKGFADTAKSMALGAAAALGIGVGISQLTRFTKAAILESWKIEQQQSKLDVILGRSGENIVETNKSIAAFADKMEYLTGVNDDQTRSLEILARQYEIQNDRIDGAIKSSIALTQIGGNLEGNLHAVANAYNGNWRELGALIPAIRAANNESERMDILQRKVAEGIDIATAAMNTHAGSWQRLGNMGKDILKGAGDFIMGVVDAADEKLFGMRKLVVENNRVILAEEEKFMSALEIMKARAGINFKGYGKPSLNQLGFIDIESDLNTKFSADLNANLKITQQLTKFEAELTKKREEAAAIVEKYGLNVEGFNEAGREQYFQILQMVGILPRFTAETQAAADEQRRLGTDTGELTEAGKEMYIQLLRMVGLLPKLSDPKPAKTITESWQEVEAQFQAVQRAIGYVDDMFAALGINSEGVTSQISNALGAASSFSAGMSSLNKEGGSLTDTLTGITSVVGAVTAAITVAIAVAKLFAGDGIGEAIKRENQWMDLNDDLKQQLKDLAKQMGDTHAATSVMLNDIIDEADISVNTFDQYAVRLREILSDLDSGHLSATAAVNEMGDAFDSLIAKAKELGTEGSASLLTYFDDLASRGLEVAEVTKYINEQWKAGLDGYKLMKASMDPGDLYERYDQLVESMRGMRVGSQEYKNALGELDALQAKLTDVKNAQDVFGGMNIQIFEQLIAYEAKVGKNQALIDGIHGATQALVSMSNATRLNEDEFDQFEKSARGAYDKLMVQGFTEKESLLELAPMLSRLQYLHEQYGLTLDDNTLKLIEMAKRDGIDLSKFKSQEVIFGDMSDSLKELVDIFKNAFPSAIKDTSDAFKDLNKNIPDWQQPYTPGQPNPKNPPNWEPAAAGWQGWVTGPKRFLAGEGSEPEYISITPQSKMRGSDSVPGGRTTQINITLAGTITPESAADAIMTAYRNNTRGLRSLLES